MGLGGQGVSSDWGLRVVGYRRLRTSQGVRALRIRLWGLGASDLMVSGVRI